MSVLPLRASSRAGIQSADSMLNFFCAGPRRHPNFPPLSAAVGKR